MKLASAKTAFLAALLGVAAACSQGRSAGTTTGGLACQACPANSSCQPNGTCECLGGYTPCVGRDGGAICTQLTLDNDNCGECGAACAAGESCAGGNCQCQLMTCPLLDGGTVCTDVGKDPMNCDQCGIPCQGDEHCISNHCTSCSPPTIYCGPDGGIGCVDITKDDNNCGGCGVVCGPTAHCLALPDDGGFCACPDGGPGTDMQSCQGACVDFKHDGHNCGGCGVDCPYGPCNPDDAGVGACACDSPFELCGTLCVEPYSDYEHCGGCTACVSPATQCVDGNCK